MTSLIYLRLLLSVFESCESPYIVEINSLPFSNENFSLLFSALFYPASGVVACKCVCVCVCMCVCGGGVDGLVSDEYGLDGKGL